MLLQLVLASVIILAALYFGGRQVEQAFRSGHELGRDSGYHIGWLDGSNDAVGCYHGQGSIKDWLVALDMRRLQRFDDHLLPDADDEDDGDGNDPDDGERAASPPPLPSPQLELVPNEPPASQTAAAS